MARSSHRRTTVAALAVTAAAILGAGVSVAAPAHAEAANPAPTGHVALAVHSGPVVPGR